VTGVGAAEDREEDRRARAALSRLGEPGDPRLAALVADLGAVVVREALLGERASPGRDRPEASGVRTDVAGRLAGIDPDRELEEAEHAGIRFVVPGDPEWPASVDDLAGVPSVQDRGEPPLGLWVRGPLVLTDLHRSVAVVGSRSATTYGADLAREVAAGTARAGLPVVSGAAFGIDQAAHRGSVAAGGTTVAVLAGGADRAYPAAHAALLDHVAATGAVVSEAPPGSTPTRLRFLARNRLIAALTRGTVVVEAALRSGALNTANWAERLSRVVMGVPGPVTSGASQGVHQLIRGGAALVTGPAEVLELVAPPGEHLLDAARGSARPRDVLSLRQQQVLDAVPVQQPVTTDVVAREAGIGLLEVHASLTRLEVRGFVRGSADGWVLGDRGRAR
jgi:DNA processing protein